MHFVTTFLSFYNLVLSHVIVMLLIETTMMNADKSVRRELHDIRAHEPETATRYEDAINFTGCIKHRHYQLQVLDVTVERLASYSESPGFKSRHGDWLSSLVLSFYSSVPPGKCWDSALNQATTTSTYFRINCLLIILSFNAVLSELLKAVSEYTKNNVTLS
jgi:hypothetical protein